MDGDGNGNGNNDDETEIPSPPLIEDELFDLGQALFFDKILSGNHDVSCATCHQPGLGTDDDLALSLGVGGTGIGSQREGGAVIPRNAPALFNLHAYRTMFWDSRVARGPGGELITPAGDQLTPAMEQTLEHGVVAAQALFPVTSADEMRGAPGSNELADIDDDDLGAIWRALMVRLGEVPAYVELFERAYPGMSFGEMTFAHAANAIAAYEIRAFDHTDSPYQRFLDGDDQALSTAELDGMDDFFDAGCDGCHSGPLLSNFDHHNTALAQIGPGKGHGAGGLDDFAREGVTGDADDRYAFRTTPLINVELTGPFGHAGQFAELRDFVDHYRNHERNLEQYDVTENVDQTELWSTSVPNTAAVLQTVDRRMRELDGFNVDDVVAFLRAMTADSARDLSVTVPSSVPSGLPLD
jgi:cytochrome c peroxidase